MEQDQEAMSLDNMVEEAAAAVGVMPQQPEMAEPAPPPQDSIAMEEPLAAAPEEPQAEQQQPETAVVPAEKQEDGTTTVSLDAVSKTDESASASSSNDVLSNIIQSLFNPNEPNQNVSIVPRMVGGKRKLCLRLPASTASALLAQTGAVGGVAGSSGVLEGGNVPKKIKIVIPSGGGQATVIQQAATAAAKPAAIKPAQIIKVPIRPGPARLPEETSTSPVRGTPPSSKPFLASLFNSSGLAAASSPTSSPKQPIVTAASPSAAIKSPAAAAATGSKPLGSTENPIQLVQEGNSFRSLQPLTPEQLKHIASVLKQNRQAILAGSPGSQGVPAGGSGTDKRKVVYDAASNTRIVYRVVTPGELKKTGTTSAAASASKATPSAR